jgi:hypothetical protein
VRSFTLYAVDVSAALAGTLDSFRRCAVSGCNAMVLPDVDELTPRCRDHKGAPVAWYRVDEWGTSPVEFVRSDYSEAR